MPSHLRTLSFVGLAFVLALLFSVSTMAAHRASAQTAQAARPLLSKTAHFVHRATSSNTFGAYTYIDNIATNNQPNAILFVTSNINVGNGSGAIGDPHPYGVKFDYSLILHYTHRWIIFNEDGAAMPLNALFNVLVVNQAAISGEVFVQTATSSNIIGNYTLIDSVFTNGNPGAQLLITQNYGGFLGHNINPHTVGVWYDGAFQKWAIFNEDGTAMPPNAHFNVMVGADSSGGGTAFLQTATSSNTDANFTSINNGLINSDPSAIVFVTHNWNPNGYCGCIYNYGVLGVTDIAPSPPLPPDQWAVTENASVPIGASFNILAFSS